VATIIGIDPGLSCGWAVRDARGVRASGVWDLRGNRFEGAGMRMVRLRSYLAELFDRVCPSIVAFEEVRRHMGTDAAHIYGAITHLVMEECERRQIPYRGVPVATVKRCATGRGAAKKDAMIAAARARWPHIEIVDDNHADALWIAEAAYRESPTQEAEEGNAA
jgi:Holliday junction resolvasome RuvABC endonuclease subunit